MYKCHHYIQIYNKKVGAYCELTFFNQDQDSFFIVFFLVSVQNSYFVALSFIY